MVLYLSYSFARARIENDDSLPITEPKCRASIYGLALNFCMQILRNSFIVCSNGSCNQIYLSTVSAFFTALGIPIFEYIKYFNFLGVLLMVLSLLSLYSVRESVFYLPFIISSIGSSLIIVNIIFSVAYLGYFGNFLMIVSAVWNAKAS